MGVGARARKTRDLEPPQLGVEETFENLEDEPINSPNSILESSMSNKIIEVDISDENVIDLDNDQEEGEIVDDFEEIISSDEELVIGQRIKELERQNAEIGKIAKTSTSHNYDYYNKPPLAINLVSDSDNEYLDYSYYQRIPQIKYLKTSQRFSISNYQQLSKKSKNKRYKKSKTKKNYINRKNEDEYEIEDHGNGNSRRHRHHKSRRKSFPLPKRNSLSRSSSSTQRSKRKHEKTRSDSPSSITLSSSDEQNSEINKLHRDQLRFALNGDSEKPRRGNIKNFRKKIKTEEDVDNKFEKNYEHNISTIKEDDTDDSVTLEEQELRLIALKSAVVQKHLKRKERRENEKPYSPSDFVDQIIQNIPSPKTIGNSPVASPIEDEDILLSEDMELVNSNSDSNDSPIFFKGNTMKDNLFSLMVEQNLNDTSIEKIIRKRKVSRTTSDDENSKLRIIVSNRSPDSNDEEECALRTLLLSQKKNIKSNIELNPIVDQKENNSNNRLVSNITPPNLTEADISDLRDMILENMKTLNNRTNSVLKQAVKRLKRERRNSDEPKQFLPKDDELKNSTSPIEISQNVNQLIIEKTNEYPEAYPQNSVQPVTENSQYAENMLNNDNFNTTLINSTNYLVPDQNLLPVPMIYPDWQFFPQNPILPINQLQYPTTSPNITKPVARSALKVIPLIHENDSIKVLSNKDSNKNEIKKDDSTLPQSLEDSKSDLESDLKTNKNEILRSRLNELEKEMEPEQIISEKKIALEDNLLMESTENEAIAEKAIQIETEEKPSCILTKKNSFPQKPFAEQSIKISHNHLLQNNKKVQNLNAQKNTTQQNKVNKKSVDVQNLSKAAEKTSSPQLIVENSSETNVIKSGKSVQKLPNLLTQTELKHKTFTNQLTTKNTKINETSKIESSRKFAPSCPRVKKLIININASSESDSDNFELEASNCTNDQSYDDNASPMSFQMDSPCYSPLNVSTKLDHNVENKNRESFQKSNVGVAKSVVNDVFEAKLNEFLKTARTNVDKAKNVDLSTTNTKASLAVCHLSKSSQDEYQKLVLRMKLLEKQKNLKIKEKNKSIEHTTVCANLTLPVKNFKVTIKNDSPCSCNPNNLVLKVDNTKLSQMNENLTITKTIVNEVALLNCIGNDEKIEKNSNHLFSNSNESNLENRCSTPKLDNPKTEDKNQEVKNCANLKHSNECENQHISSEIINAQHLVEENERKAKLLERYEQAYEKNGTNMLSNLNKAIDLINLGKREKIKKNELQSHLEHLKKEYEKYEMQIKIQNNKISKIYPEISKSHRIINDFQTRRLKLSRVAKNLGKIVKGDNYSLKDEKSTDIFTKFKDFSNGITVLKNFKIKDVKNRKLKFADNSEINVKILNISESSEPNLELSNSNISVELATNSDLLHNESNVNTSEYIQVSTEIETNSIEIKAVEDLEDINVSKCNIDSDTKNTSTELVDVIEILPKFDIQYSQEHLILKQDPVNNGIYESPLAYDKSCFPIDPNAILCPFQLKGLCDDTECKFQHLKFI